MTRPKLGRSGDRIEDVSLRGQDKSRDDGTRELLRWGLSTLATGILAALLTKIVFGGIGEQGPHTNSGWMALIVAMMCLPFGFMLTILGAAKWIRNRRGRT